MSKWNETKQQTKRKNKSSAEESRNEERKNVRTWNRWNTWWCTQRCESNQTVDSFMFRQHENGIREWNGTQCAIRGANKQTSFRDRQRWDRTVVVCLCWLTSAPFAESLCVVCVSLSEFQSLRKCGSDKSFSREIALHKPRVTDHRMPAEMTFNVTQANCRHFSLAPGVVRASNQITNHKSQIIHWRSNQIQLMTESRHNKKTRFVSTFNRYLALAIDRHSTIWCSARLHTMIY